MRKGRALGGAESRESGETLVEILMTIAIVAISFVAIMGAIFTALRVTDYHRTDTNATVLVRNWAELLKSPSGTYQYIPCTTAGGTVSYPAPPASLTTDSRGKTWVFTPTVTYLTDATATTPSYQSGCPASDQGAQQITLRVDSPASTPAVHAGETLTIIKRCALGENGNPGSCS